MQISKERLTYNLIIIGAALLIFFFTYPSNIANIILIIFSFFIDFNSRMMNMEFVV